MANFGFVMNDRMYPLVIMFNTSFEHLFVSQSLLKHRWQHPTDGLRVAFKELLEGGVSMPSSP